MLKFFKSAIRLRSTILNNFHEKKNRNEKNGVDNFDIEL